MKKWINVIYSRSSNADEEGGGLVEAMDFFTSAFLESHGGKLIIKELYGCGIDGPIDELLNLSKRSEIVWN